MNQGPPRRSAHQPITGCRAWVDSATKPVSRPAWPAWKCQRSISTGKSARYSDG